MPTIAIDLNGYTDLPRGKIANVVTYLERREPVARTPPAEFAGLAVRHVVRPATGWYRDLYRRIGEQWLWFSRSIIPDLELSRILTDPMTQVLALERDGHALGLAELTSAFSQEVEIAMFGVVSEVTGTGAAGFLMDHALSQAFAAPGGSGCTPAPGIIRRRSRSISGTGSAPTNTPSRYRMIRG
jgi:hypothetical protein